MRFAELGLLKYGRFDGVTLPFRPGSPDLHIIFGPNEAGKSTTLEAVGDLLFGFSNVTRYAFRYDLKLLRIKATIEGDGTSLQCVRKRGKKDTLLDPEELPLDEGRLAALLHGLDRATYRLGWSLDHARLRQGGKDIVEAKDDLGHALFAASAGLATVTQTLEAIDEDAAKIWTRQSRDRLFAKSQRLYDEARSLLKSAQTRPATWESARKDLQRLEIEIAAKHQVRASAQLRLASLERTRRVLAPIGKRAAALLRLEALGDPLQLPVGAADALSNAEQTISKCEAALKASVARLGALEASLKALPDDHGLLDLGSAVDGLSDRRGAYLKAQEDLPKRLADLAREKERMTDLLRELGWHQESAARVSELLPPRAHAEVIRSRITAKAALDARFEAMEASRKSSQRLVDESRRALEATSASQPIDLIEGAYRSVQKQGDLSRELEDRAVARKSGAAALETALAQLGDWSSGGAGRLQDVRIPSEHAISAAQQMQDEIRNALAEIDKELARTGDTRQTLELRSSQLTQGGLVVSDDALQQARAERDRSIQSIRTRVVQSQPFDDPVKEFSGYEQMVSHADSLADLRFAAADEAAQLAAIEAKLEELDLLTTQLRARRDQQSVLSASAVAQWKDLLLQGKVPFTSPGQLRDWGEKQHRALKLITDLAALDERREQQKGLIEKAEASLRNTLRISDPLPDLKALMAIAESRVSAASAEATQQLRLATELEAATNSLAASKAESDELQPLLAEWQETWDRLLTASSLQSASPEAVKGHLAAIDGLREIVNAILDLEHRTKAMEADAVTFESSIAALAGTYLVGTEASPPALLEKLKQLHESAKASTERRATLLGELEAERLRCQELTTEGATAEASLEHLLELTSDRSMTTLAKEIARAADVHSAREELREYEIEAIEAGDGLPIESLVALTTDVETDSLKVETDAASEIIARLNQELDEFGTRHGAAKQTFGAFGAGDDALQALADAEEAAAELEGLAETWISKTVQALLLRRAIEEHRISKQNPLLTRASDLFRRLTLNAYDRLSVEYDLERSTLFGIRHGGTEAVKVDGMSDGTVDQLFLALRMAAVEDSIEHGVCVPFLADDLFINFDNERAAIGLEILAELARKTQVLFFTHHEHLTKIAERTLSPCDFSLSRLA